MTPDVYIIRRGTPESRLLGKLGIDRDSLPVVEWRGTSRARGGHGKSPVAWRVSGEAKVELLCEGIVRILGSKPDFQRSADEDRALSRAKRTLAGYRSRQRRESAAIDADLRRGEVVGPLLDALFPSGRGELQCVAVTLYSDPVHSVAELADRANVVLKGRPAVWAQARNEFLAVITAAMCDTLE